MTDGERLKVIQICNNEDNKIKMEDIYNKLPNNYKYPNCKYQNHFLLHFIGDIRY